MMKKLIAKVEEKQFTVREYCLIGIGLFLLGLLLGIVFSPKGDRTITNNGIKNGNDRENSNADCLNSETADEENEE